jgi:RND superfamily putative drug exporter
MLTMLSAAVSKRRRLVLGLALLFCVVAAALGGTVSAKLSAGGYAVPGGQSATASAMLSSQFATGEPNLVLLVETPDGADDTQTAQSGAALTAEVAAMPGVQQAASYWSLGRVPVLRSLDGDSALLLVNLKGNEDEVNRTLDQIRPRLAGGFDGLQVKFGGQAEAYRALTEQSAKDLLIAETIVTPLLLLLLIFVFRGVIAALMPLVLGFVAILGALAVLRVLVSFTDVSIFAMNLTTGLGLGLGIDYSLFVITRYREELASGASVNQAIATSMRTAGRTVLFSAVTVALSLCGLLLFPMYFLRSFAYAGIAVVIFAAVSTLVILPALLAVVGRNIDKWSWRRPKPRHSAAIPFWRGLATFVTRRPIPLAAVAIAVLLLLGAPFLSIRFSLADARQLPSEAESHQVQTAMTDDYSAKEMDPLLVVASGTVPTGSSADISSYAATLSEISGVARVDALTGSFAGGVQVAPATPVSQRFAGPSSTWLSVVPSVEPYSDDGQAVVRDVRATPAPWPVLVGGTAASFRDTLDSLAERIPYALAVIGISTFVLLFLLSGGVLVPLKALLLNLLSLTATFGAMVWIFQEGHLSGLLGDFTVTGAVVATIPIMMFCMAFGLSMDYEVFLISRIKEEYDATGDNTTAIIRGMERTGGLITAAASLMALVLISFASSGVTFMKLLGLGLAIAVLIDATIVRGILVPALMRLAGRANWWAPPLLRRFHRRFGLSEGGTAPESAGVLEEADEHGSRRAPMAPIAGPWQIPADVPVGSPALK